MSARVVTYYKNQGMSATLTGAPIDCRGARRIAWQNYYSSATPNGNFTYQVTNDPMAAKTPGSVQWTTVTPTSTHGAQPNGTAAGTFAVVFTDLFHFMRQVWTRTAGGAGDLLTTYVDLDAV